MSFDVVPCTFSFTPCLYHMFRLNVILIHLYIPHANYFLLVLYKRAVLCSLVDFGGITVIIPFDTLFLSTSAKSLQRLPDHGYITKLQNTT